VTQVCFAATGDILAHTHGERLGFFRSSSAHESVHLAQLGHDPCCHIVRISGRHSYCSFWVEAV